LYCANINPGKRNFHLRITWTQQNPKILVHIPINKKSYSQIIRSH